MDVFPQGLFKKGAFFRRIDNRAIQDQFKFRYLIQALAYKIHVGFNGFQDILFPGHLNNCFGIAYGNFALVHIKCGKRLHKSYIVQRPVNQFFMFISIGQFTGKNFLGNGNGQFRNLFFKVVDGCSLFIFNAFPRLIHHFF